MRTTVLILLFVQVAAALNIKMRAREHFEEHTLSGSNLEATYSGLSNTINVWHEVPLKYSIGLAISPIIGEPKLKSGDETLLGESMQVHTYGIEGKYFPLDGLNGFLRGGAYWTKLFGNGPANTATGTTTYLGLGWEIPVWKVHLAPEYAVRSGSLSNDFTLNSWLFSLGVHFYKM